MHTQNLTVRSRICLAIAALLLPVSVLAVAPTSVTNVAATYHDGKVTVTWLAPAGSTDIASYRIYTSHQSMLAGNPYDEYQETQGPVTGADIIDLPPIPTLFVTVSAVNSAGEESAFASEATVSLGTQPTQPATPTTTTTPTRFLELLSAHATSATGVVLTFSAPIVSPLPQAATIDVRDLSGTVLTISGATVQGDFLILQTSPMRSDIPYVVAVAGFTSSQDSGSLPLNPERSMTTFLNETTEAPTAPPLGSPTGPIPDVTGLTLHGEALHDGYFAVSADFSLPSNAQNVAAFQVLQSIDGGETFMLPQTVSPDIRHLHFDRVPPGIFTILIRSSLTNGMVSTGVTASVKLSPVAPTPVLPGSPLTGSVTAGAHPLSRSGAGALVVFAASGAIAGWKRMKKRKA